MTYTNGFLTAVNGYADAITYDGFGNLLSLTANGVLRNTPTAAGTNRLTGSVAYDAAGNLTGWNGAAYTFDKLNQMWRVVNGTEDWLYLYSADGERIWSFKASTNTSRWTLRDLDGKVLREYQNAGGTWTIQRDYVYRGSQLLAAHTADAAPKDRIQFHIDHLGTPRAITDKTGTRITYHVYYPFGEEATSPTQDLERMKFTGHERDLANIASAADDLDYMHAPFYNPQTGRFLSTDPIDSWNRKRPQSWNLYAYVSNNPLGFNDPDGQRQNPVTGQRGVAPPAYGVKGALRTNSTNPAVGRFGNTRTDGQGNPRYHSGIDINAPTGTPLRAPEDGTIVSMTRGPIGGNRIDIKTTGGETVILVHLDSFAVGLKAGDSVGEGDIVGESGTTGNQPSPGDPGYDAKQEHVHMTVNDPNGQNIDPEAWLNDPNAPPPK